MKELCVLVLHCIVFFAQDVELVGLFTAAYCQLIFEDSRVTQFSMIPLARTDHKSDHQDNQNLYAHQAVQITLDVSNPQACKVYSTFQHSQCSYMHPHYVGTQVALPAEDWQA